MKSNKKCIRCLKCYSRSSGFTKDKKYTDGLNSYCKKCTHKAVTRSILKLKTEIVKAYGGQCKCCGEKEIRFLTFDHGARGVGAAHKLAIQKGTKYARPQQVYCDLRRRNFPKICGYKILCSNCHIATMHGRRCPHKIKQAGVAEMAIRKRLKIFRLNCRAGSSPVSGTTIQYSWY